MEPGEGREKKFTKLRPLLSLSGSCQKVHLSCDARGHLLHCVCVCLCVCVSVCVFVCVCARTCEEMLDSVGNIDCLCFPICLSLLLYCCKYMISINNVLADLSTISGVGTKCQLSWSHQRKLQVGSLGVGSLTHSLSIIHSPLLIHSVTFSTYRNPELLFQNG